jgi:hypothetical protein
MHDEESKTDFVMDWLAPDPEFKEFVRSKLKALAMVMAVGKHQFETNALL